MNKAQKIYVFLISVILFAIIQSIIYPSTVVYIEYTILGILLSFIFFVLLWFSWNLMDMLFTIYFILGDGENTYNADRQSKAMLKKLFTDPIMKIIAIFISKESNN